MKQEKKNAPLIVLWETVPDLNSRELLRKVFAIIFSDDAPQSTRDNFDENTQFGQDEYVVRS
jgi:hypothetical protein